MPWHLPLWPCGWAALWWLTRMTPRRRRPRKRRRIGRCIGQATFTDQYHPAFTSPYRGPNSLDPASRGNETFDATLSAGSGCGKAARPISIPRSTRASASVRHAGRGGVSQRGGLQDRQGGALFPAAAPVLPSDFRSGRRHRRRGSRANHLAGYETADNLVITAGKFSVADIFDANSYAHDPRGDFLNWAT